MAIHLRDAFIILSKVKIGFEESFVRPSANYVDVHRNFFVSRKPFLATL